MNAVTVNFGGQSVSVDISGARGPLGPASGPLGAGSVTAATISNDSGEQDSILTKLRGVQYTSGGGIFVDGGVASSLGLARDDGNFVAKAAEDQRVIWLSIQDDPASEAAWTAYFAKDGGGYFQSISMFTALSNNDNTTDAIPYVGFHGEMGDETDNTSAVFWNNNSGRFGCGQTGLAPWNSVPRENLFETFVDHRIRGGLTVGPNIDDATMVGTQANIEGYLTVGAVTGTAGAATPAQTWQIGYHAGSTSILDQAYNFATSAFMKRILYASEFRFGQGHMLPDTDNNINLGSGSFRFDELFAGTGTINTSDKRLKKVIGAPKPEEIAWANSIKFVAYQWLDAVARANDPDDPKEFARIHWGPLAQDVAEAGRQAGIADPYRYSFLTLDPLFETVEEEVEVERQAVREEKVKVRSIKEIDGRAVIVEEEVTHTVPATRKLPLYDANGHRVHKEKDDPRGPYKTLDPKTGRRKQRPKIKVPVEVEVPVMETAKETVRREVPVIDPETGEQDMRHGVRRDELLMFLWACSRA